MPGGSLVFSKNGKTVARPDLVCCSSVYHYPLLMFQGVGTDDVLSLTFAEAQELRKNLIEVKNNHWNLFVYAFSGRYRFEAKDEVSRYSILSFFIVYFQKNECQISRELTAQPSIPEKPSIPGKPSIKSRASLRKF